MRSSASVAWRRRPRAVVPLCVAAVLTALTPALILVSRGADRAYQKAWFELGRPEIGYLDSSRDETTAQVNYTGFGAVGLVLALAGVVLVVRAVRAGELRRLALLLAVAPAVWLVLVGLTVTSFPWNARFAMAGYALAGGRGGWRFGCGGSRGRCRSWPRPRSSSCSCTCARSRPASACSSRVIRGRSSPSSAGRRCPRGRGSSRSPAFVSERLPADAAVAAWPFHYPETRDRYAAPDLLPYLLFGPRLQGTVSLARDPAAAACAGAEWYLTPTARLPAGCVPGWRRVEQTASGWSILRREATACG